MAQYKDTEGYNSGQHAVAPTPAPQPTAVRAPQKAAVAPAAPPAAPPAPTAPQTAPGLAQQAVVTGQKIPAGGKLYAVNGVLAVVYNVDGVNVYYDFSAPGTMQQVNLSGSGPPATTQEFSSLPNLVHGGMVQEIYGIQEPTYQDWITKQYGIATGGASWATDPEMRKIYLGWVVNPEISQEEIQGQVRQTNYWKQRTELQSTYSELSPAEQARRDQDEAAQLAQKYFSVTGQQIALGDAQLSDWAHQIASGTATEGGIIENAIKPLALQNAESPWARTLRDELEQQRQRPVDIENKTQEVQDLYNRWGVQASPDTFKQWGSQIVGKQASDADLLQYLQTTSKTLYPWKDPNTETATAAEPWMATYARVLERPAAGLFDPDIQKALQTGAPPFQFEQDLKRKNEWLDTKNAQDTLTQMASSASQRMGITRG